MSSLLHTSSRAERPPTAADWLAIVTPVVAVLLLLLAPGDLATKTHLILQGFCAQRPSHSLYLGGIALPMDARMTGIYIGAATMILWLAATGRLRRTGRLSRAVLATLVFSIGAMAIDGGNALLVDLGLEPLYAPGSGLRLFTGLIAGGAIGVIVAHLFAISVWRRGERRHAVVASPRELLVPLLIGAFLCGLAASNLGALYAPVAIGLVLAVFVTIWPLSFTMAALLGGRGWAFSEVRAMGGTAVWANVVTLGVIAAASLGRGALEVLWHIPSLP